MTKWMHCVYLIVRYAVLSNSAALFLECVHYRLNWPEKGVHLINSSQKMGEQHKATFLAGLNLQSFHNKRYF